MDVLGLHEIAEANHRILNPFTAEKLDLLGEICRLETGMLHLDLACGKGEMLCQWAARYGTRGLGVDISEVFLPAARARAEALGVTDQVTFELADAGRYAAEPASYDVVSCLGATWIGGGLAGTLRLMQRPLKPGGLVLVGEPYWRAEPPADAYTATGTARDDFTSLTGTLDRFESAGLSLVEMVLADEDSWDRYAAAQWWTLAEWLDRNVQHPDVPAVAEFLESSRRTYLSYERPFLGWGAFVLRNRR